MISRVISALNGVTLIIALLRTNLLSPLPLQVGLREEVAAHRAVKKPSAVAPQGAG